MHSNFLSHPNTLPDPDMSPSVGNNLLRPGSISQSRHFGRNLADTEWSALAPNTGSKVLQTKYKIQKLARHHKVEC